MKVRFRRFMDHKARWFLENALPVDHARSSICFKLLAGCLS